MLETGKGPVERQSKGRGTRMMSAKLRFVVLAPVAALLAAACGGTTEPQPAGGEGDVQAFCDAHFTAQQAAITAIQEGSGDEEVQPLLDELRMAAPTERVGDVDAFNNLLTEAFQADDPFTVIESPEFREHDELLDVYMAENCGYERVEVTAIEYSFTGVPDTIGAGRVALTLTNGGAEVHEMGFGLFKEDVDLSVQEVLDLPDREQDKQFQPSDVGHFLAPPGGIDTEVIEVVAGRYGFICFIPQGTMSLEDLEGQHGGEGKPHAFLGMFGEFVVEAA